MLRLQLVLVLGLTQNIGRTFSPGINNVGWAPSKTYPRKDKNSCARIAPWSPGINSREFYTCPQEPEQALSNAQNMAEDKLNIVQEVDIDSDGRFKYILIRVMSPQNQEKYIVRGYRRAGYHADIYDEVEPFIKHLGLSCDCPGGGRIQHDSVEKRLKVYGYSQGYGRADHAKTVEILKRQYPHYDITWSNSGY